TVFCSPAINWTRGGKHLKEKNDEEFKFPNGRTPGDPTGRGGVAAGSFAPKVRSRGSRTKQTKSASVRSCCPKRRKRESTGGLVRYSARDSRRNSDWSPGKSRRSSCCAGSGG